MTGGGIQPGGVFLMPRAGAPLLDIEVAPVLPSVAVQDRIAVVAEGGGRVFVGASAPDDPVAGDIWIVTREAEHTLDVIRPSPSLTLGLFAARKFGGSSWDAADGYVGKDGAWARFSSGMPAAGQPLEAYTWAQIDAIGKAGLARQYWAVGERKAVSIQGVDHAFEIIGFDHDNRADGGGKAPISFLMATAYQTQYPMFSTTGTAAQRIAWPNFTFRTSALPALYNALPTEVRGVMKPVVKLSYAKAQSYGLFQSADSLWLPSATELGVSYLTVAGQGVAYERFTDDASRIRPAYGGTAGTVWWLRSRNNSTGTTYYDYVNTINASGKGSGNAGLAGSNSRGVVLGFCV